MSTPWEFFRTFRTPAEDAGTLPPELLSAADADVNSPVKVFVNRIPPQTSKSVVVDFFSPYGKVLAVEMVKKSETKNMVALLTIESLVAAHKAIGALHNRLALQPGPPCRVVYAEKELERLNLPPTLQPGYGSVRLFVGNLPSGVDIDTLVGIFKKYGPLLEIYLLPAKKGRPAAFVAFRKMRDGLVAMGHLNGKIPEGCDMELMIRFAEAQKREMSASGDAKGGKGGGQRTSPETRGPEKPVTTQQQQESQSLSKPPSEEMGGGARQGQDGVVSTQAPAPPTLAAQQSPSESHYFAYHQAQSSSLPPLPKLGDCVDVQGFVGQSLPQLSVHETRAQVGESLELKRSASGGPSGGASEAERKKETSTLSAPSEGLSFPLQRAPIPSPPLPPLHPSSLVGTPNLTTTPSLPLPHRPHQSLYGGGMQEQTATSIPQKLSPANQIPFPLPLLPPNSSVNNRDPPFSSKTSTASISDPINDDLPLRSLPPAESSTSSHETATLSQPIRAKKHLEPISEDSATSHGHSRPSSTSGGLGGQPQVMGMDSSTPVAFPAVNSETSSKSASLSLDSCPPPAAYVQQLVEAWPDEMQWPTAEFEDDVIIPSLEEILNVPFGHEASEDPSTTEQGEPLESDESGRVLPVPSPSAGIGGDLWGRGGGGEGGGASRTLYGEETKRILGPPGVGGNSAASRDTPPIQSSWGDPAANLNLLSSPNSAAGIPHPTAAASAADSEPEEWGGTTTSFRTIVESAAGSDSRRRQKQVAPASASAVTVVGGRVVPSPAPPPPPNPPTPPARIATQHAEHANAAGLRAQIRGLRTAIVTAGPEAHSRLVQQAREAIKKHVEHCREVFEEAVAVQELVALFRQIHP